MEDTLIEIEKLADEVAMLEYENCEKKIHPSVETVSGNLVNVLEPDPKTITIEDIAWSLSRIPRFGGHSITPIPYTVGQHCLFCVDELNRFVDIMLGHNTDEFLLTETHSKVQMEFGAEIPYSIYTQMANVIYSIFSSKDCDRLLDNLYLEMLLHDAAESYIGDITSPVKNIPELRDILKAIEDRLLTTIYQSVAPHLIIDERSAIKRNTLKYFDLLSRSIEAHAFMQSRGTNWSNKLKVSFPRLQSFLQPVDALTTYNEFMDRYYSLLPR